MTYIKGFVVGFSLTSFIVMYKTKGVILSFLYLIFGQLLNIFAVLLLMIYSILFSTKLLKQIFKDKTNTLSNFIKKYYNKCSRRSCWTIVIQHDKYIHSNVVFNEKC